MLHICKRMIAGAVLLFMALGLASCKEKLTLDTQGLETQISDELFYGRPELIVKATVQQKADEYFTNPDGDFNKNAHITVYEILISEVYKGAPADSAMQIKLFNGEGLSPELYLYGEDDDYILERKVEPFLLEEGQEYILGLSYLDPEKYNCYGDPGGYGIQFGELWTFVQNEDGLYVNLKEGSNHKEIDLATLKDKIAAFGQTE